MRGCGSGAERIYEIGREVAVLEGSGESSNELVTAVVGVGHDLRSLRIDPRAYREPDADALARAVLEAIRAACDEVDRRAHVLTGPLLSDGGDPDLFLRTLDALTGTQGTRGSR